MENKAEPRNVAIFLMWVLEALEFVELPEEARNIIDLFIEEQKCFNEQQQDVII